MGLLDKQIEVEKQSKKNIMYNLKTYEVTLPKNFENWSLMMMSCFLDGVVCGKKSEDQRRK